MFHSGPAEGGSWCSRNETSPEFQRLQALALLRRLLVLSQQQQGPAGLLDNTEAVEALQDLLPFVPLMQLATHSFAAAAEAADGSRSSSRGLALGGPEDLRSRNLLLQLPPAQRAWLLADAAEAVLLHDGNDSSR
jgi:hypothetical protein